jgi:short-subunit dehydrogenase
VRGPVTGASSASAPRLADVDVLVDNAGESQSGSLEELPVEAVERLFRVDVLTPYGRPSRPCPGCAPAGTGGC